MNAPDSLALAKAQIWLSAIFLVGVFVLALVFELGYSRLTDGQEKVFEHTLNWMEGAALIVLYFWFQRQRGGGFPDAPTITQTHTGADGSKTVTTGPASSVTLPPPPSSGAPQTTTISTAAAPPLSPEKP